MRSNVKSGSLNETMILIALNKHYFKDLDSKWKRHLKRMFKDIKDDDYIIANYFEYKDAKPDIEIIVNKRKVLLSIKSGHAPVMHHEPVYTFFDFLRKQNVPEKIIKIIAFYHYGFSLKKGITDHILSREEIIEKYPSQIKEANDYFKNHQEIVREMIYRTIIKGRLDRDLIDYFYYGNSTKGFLLSTANIINMIANDRNEYNKTIHFNSLTYVSRARNPNNHRKHNIDISWPKLCLLFYDEKFMKKYG